MNTILFGSRDSLLMRKGLLHFYYSNLCQIGNVYHWTCKQRNYPNTVSKWSDCLGTLVFGQFLWEPPAVHSISIIELWPKQMRRSVVVVSGGQNSKENCLLILNQLPFNPSKSTCLGMLTLANPDKVMFLSSC